VSYAPEKRAERQKRVVLSAQSLYAENMEITTVMTALKCDFFCCIYPKQCNNVCFSAKILFYPCHFLFYSGYCNFSAILGVLQK
jgi:hypothetical protein